MRPSATAGWERRAPMSNARHPRRGSVVRGTPGSGPSRGPAFRRILGAGNRRGVALALHAWFGPPSSTRWGAAARTIRAPRTVREPCPLDTWRSSLVASAIAAVEAQVVAFWNTTAGRATTSKGAGGGLPRRVPPRHRARATTAR